MVWQWKNSPLSRSAASLAFFVTLVLLAVGFVTLLMLVDCFAILAALAFDFAILVDEWVLEIDDQDLRCT